MFVFILIVKLSIVKKQKCFFFFLFPPKNFNFSFINVGRETPFLEKTEIQALMKHIKLI